MNQAPSNADTSDVWEQIATSVDRFLADCRSDLPIPEISKYLTGLMGSAKSLAIIELAKVHMEQCYHLGEQPTLEYYLEKFPELYECAGGAPIDLVLEAVQLAQQHGRRGDLEKYLLNYPEHAGRLRQLLNIPADSHSRIGKPWRCPIEGLRAGDSLEDFEIVRLLGRGAFAQVYLAHQRTMGRVVALKISADRGDEARTLAQMDHAHIIRVYDVRQLVDLNARLLSMQFAPGGTLQSVISALGERPYWELNGATLLDVIDQHLSEAATPPPEESERRNRIVKASWPEAICDIGIQLAEGLAYAHQCGVLHRDVKPANVLLTAEGVCKLADFNVSFSNHLNTSQPSSYFGGSLAYMSPEQMRATLFASGVSPADLDQRSDIFSLCAVLWELLTFARPWPVDSPRSDWDSTVSSMLDNRADHHPTAPEFVTDRPAAKRLLDVLRQGLRFDRAQRIGSAEELAGQLRLAQIPQAWGILHPEQNLWRRVVCQFPWVSAGLIIFLPHALAGVFNYQYNLSWLMSAHPEGYQQFRFVSILINFVAFGGGGLIYLAVFSDVVNEVRHRFGTDFPEASRVLPHAIQLPLKVAFIGLSLWLVAGLMFPVALFMMIPGFHMRDAAHFFGSLAISGAIAVAYPFLGCSLIVLEAWYGVLVGRRLHDRELHRKPLRLLTVTDRILLVSGGVPLLGMGFLLLQNNPARGSLIMLVLAGGLGLVAAYLAQQRIYRVMNWLRLVVSAR